jgi:RNA-binding protein YhbY
MPLTSQQRRAFVAASHRLPASLTISSGEIGEAVVAHVRSAFASRELIKVRVNAEHAPECDAAAAELAARVPCEIVKRIGHVVLLYQSARAEED